MFDYTAALAAHVAQIKAHMQEHGCTHVDTDPMSGRATCSLGADVRLPVYFNGVAVERDNPLLPPAVLAHLGGA